MVDNCDNSLGIFFRPLDIFFLAFWYIYLGKFDQSYTGVIFEKSRLLADQLQLSLCYDPDPGRLTLGIQVIIIKITNNKNNNIIIIIKESLL